MSQLAPKNRNPAQLALNPLPARHEYSNLWSPRILLSALCCLISFGLGRYTTSSCAETGGILPCILIPLLLILTYTHGCSPIDLVTEHTHVFKYNRTFGEAPSPQSDAAWAEVFPEYGGYITHPELAPDRGAIAAFHQLHCLNNIRKAFWTAYELSHTNSSDHLSDHRRDLSSHHISPPHVRHCIDLIRQRLMCQPDLTMERLDSNLGGVTGFGTAHQCNDWGRLYDFVGEWEYYGMDEAAVLRHKALIQSQRMS